MLLPALIDTPAVRAEIQRRLSEALQGQVSWQALEIALLPVPHGELQGLRVEIPDKVSVAAEGVKVDLRLWPLLLGSPEISSVSVHKPTVHVVAGEPSGEKLDAVTLYRKIMEPVGAALRGFAPDTELRIEGASINIGELRELNLDARTREDAVEVQASATSAFWQRLAVKGRVEYADLAARAQVELDELVTDKDVPRVRLRAQLQTDARTVVECEFDARAGTLATAKGKVQLPAGKPPHVAVQVDAIDLAQALALARRKAAGLEAIESAEGHVSAHASASLAEPWHAEIAITKSDAVVKLAPLPWKISPQSGSVTITPERVQVAGLKGRVGESSFERVAADVRLGDAPRLSAASGNATLDLAQWLPWLRTRASLEEIDSLSGRAEVALHRLALRFDRPAEAVFDATVAPRAVSAALKTLPAPLRIADGSVRAGRSQVRLEKLRGSLGASTFSEFAARIELGKTPRLTAASGRATLQLEQWFPWLQAKFPMDDVISASGGIDVALKRLALRFDRPAEADYEASVVPRKVSAMLKTLPGPVEVADGTVHVDRERVRLQDVAVAILDARAQVSGSYSLKKQALELALAEGIAGEKLVQWGLERGSVPARFEPKTPLRFVAQRLAWTPKGALEADARLQFDGGPQVALVLGWQPDLLELRRVAIKDAASGAVLGARVAQDAVQVSFAGTLHGRSIAGMLRRPGAETSSGTAHGELRVTIDRKQPARTLAEGKLRIEGLDLTWLAGKKALVERADLVAERTGGRITGARFGWDDQFFELRGEGRRTDQGPVINARIESAGVDVLRLLPPPDPNAPRKKSSAIWPLPVSGRVELASAFVQYKDHRIEPFDGVLSLEPRRARLEVKQARMCGVSFPMEVEAEPENNSAAVHVTVKDEPLEQTVRCLTGGNIEITGNADLRAELRAQGRRPHLLRDMTGTAQAELRRGRVKKFALLGNILSFRGIASLGEMKQDGFPYRSIIAKGHFENGQFLVEESFFDSDAVRLAAHGRVDMLGANSQLSVLVGLLTRVDRIAGAIPIIGDIFGGSMTALPMAVHGDIRDPVIVPLGPRAVTDQLLGIFERTLKLPGKLVPAPEAK